MRSAKRLHWRKVLLLLLSANSLNVTKYMSIKISASSFSLFPPLIYISLGLLFHSPCLSQDWRWESFISIFHHGKSLPAVIERHPTPQCDTYSSTVSRSPITAFSTDPSFSSHLLLSFIFTRWKVLHLSATRVSSRSVEPSSKHLCRW